MNCTVTAPSVVTTYALELQKVRQVSYSIIPIAHGAMKATRHDTNHEGRQKGASCKSLSKKSYLSLRQTNKIELN